MQTLLYPKFYTSLEIWLKVSHEKNRVLSEKRHERKSIEERRVKCVETFSAMSHIRLFGGIEGENGNKQIFFKVNFMCFVYQCKVWSICSHAWKKRARKEWKLIFKTEYAETQQKKSQFFFIEMIEKCVFSVVCLYFRSQYISFRIRCISLLHIFFSAVIIIFAFFFRSLRLFIVSGTRSQVIVI